MRAVVIQQYGSPDGLEVIDLPVPPASDGEVLIRVEAIGVGGVDAVIRRGTVSGSGFGRGLIPGSEIAGTVVETGDGIDPAWVGRRVWAFTGTSGGYVEFATVGLADVVPLPDELSAVDAVTLGSALPVAHFALRHARFEPGESVLVRGAAGSLGIGAVELAARAGASTVAVTTSSAGRGDRLRQLGATLVLDREGNEVRATHEVPAAHAARTTATGTPSFDVIIDIVGGPRLPDFLDRLAPNGRLVSVGIVAGPPPADFGMKLFAQFQQSRSFATFSLNTVPTADRDAYRAEAFEAAARGEFHAVVDDVLPLTEAAEAHRRMDAGTVFGRIVLVP